MKEAAVVDGHRQERIFQRDEPVLRAGAGLLTGHGGPVSIQPPASLVH